MTAIACLKVFAGEDPADTERNAALVAKVACDYLKTAWTAPRRHGQVAPFSFVLADPRATRLDARELQALARALQHKLFGDDDTGEIVMLMFEGDQHEVMRFAGLPARQLTLLLAGEEDASLAGRVCRITPREVRSVMPMGGPVAGTPSMEALSRLCPRPPPARTTWRGVYHSGRQLFVGNVAVWREPGTMGKAYETYVDGLRTPHDLAILKTAIAAIGPNTGVAYLPISFSAVLKPALRAELERCLRALPRDLRGRLAAGVYGVPRAPSFVALGQLKAFLDPYFSRLDLRVSDPAFQIEDLPPGLAASITFNPEGEVEASRVAAISRFLKDAPAYRRRQVWQGVSDLRSPRELATALDLGAPFVSGPMVTDLLESPAAVAPYAKGQLPLYGWTSATADAA
ncbi:hypothetical protein [Caulobacter hibisci]|uniref:Uncharacterized protein n=1 Tax=Caulobacter hibisci TaxID=2035993 RepID=A0ABS0SSC0_9CAUL|nr:hypothetical protein [Caulobacter hibisci]MBI1682066.1 hypothetical protein [Caulobacter hibisci]